MRSRLVALALAVSVLGTGACGRAVRTNADATPRSNALAAESARVVCEKDTIRLEAPVVRARRDGVHLVFENPGGLWGVQLHHETWDYGQAEDVTRLQDGVTNGTSSMPPGNVIVACVRARDSIYSDPDTATARLTIVDPDGLFVPWDLACGFGEQSRITVAAGRNADPGEVYQQVAGVRASDELRQPLYPESPQYSARVRVVFRDGAAVARFFDSGIGEEWELLVNACPGSRIAGA